MKRLVIILISICFFASATKAFAFCLDFTGKFTANNWPSSDAKLKVWCDGDVNPGPSQCTGSSQEVGPNQNFNLDKCSCLVDPTGRCLQVDKLPAGCTIKTVPLACGTNGPDAVIADFQVDCPAPPPPPGECKPGDTRTAPTCSKCDVNGHWQSDYSVGDYKTCFCQDNPNDSACKPATECTPGDIQHPPKACRVCDVNGNWQHDYSNDDYKTCLCIDEPGNPACSTATPTTAGPTSTPPVGGPSESPTEGPKCDASCSDDKDCSGAKDSCTYCEPVTHTCQKPPISSPSSSPSASPSPSAPPVTPTPTVELAKCTCDGLDASSIIAGTNAKFTARGKVVGADPSKAKITDIDFGIFEGTTVIDHTTSPIPANQISSGAENVYEASWSTLIPTTLKPGVDYRVKATIHCEKLTAYAEPKYPYTTVVLGVSTQKGGFIQDILGFISGLFGKKNSTSHTSTGTQDFQSVQDKESLQLKTFQPATVSKEYVQNACPIIKFRFE